MPKLFTDRTRQQLYLAFDRLHPGVNADAKVEILFRLLCQPPRQQRKQMKQWIKAISEAASDHVSALDAKIAEMREAATEHQAEMQRIVADITPILDDDTQD